MSDPARDLLQVEWVPFERLYLNPSNPRHNDEAVPHVAASIRRFGWRQPLVARPSGEVVAGNTRLKAAQSLGLKEVPVVWFEGSDLEATAYAIADNRTHEFAEWDDPALAKLLEQLRQEDALEGVGYSTEDIDQLLAELAALQPPAALEDPGPEEPPENPITQTGDLWLLGEHRLLCGDSTKGEDLARVMAGEKATLLATDPPYCVDYTGAERPRNAEGRGGGKDWSQLYREVDIKDLGDFLRAVFQAVLPHLKDDAGIYVWHAHLQYPVLDRVFEEFDLLRHQPIIWVKPSSTMTYAYYRWAHEPCLFGWKQGHKPPHYLENGLTSVWEADWDGKARQTTFHPTAKPTRLFEIPMEQHTRPGAVVLEPFCGSGSQIIAAEKLRRRCRALELVPAFVDGTILRWERATRREAVLAATGRTFAATVVERQAS